MAKKENILIAPAAEDWEVWRYRSERSPERIDTVDSPREFTGRAEITLGVPVRHVFALPLWILGGEDALLGDMVRLQLERRGLAPGGSGPTVIEHVTLATEEQKRLVLCVVLAASLPEEICLANATGFEPSPRLYALPPDGITLWQEQGRIVMAVTRGAELAYFQRLCDSGLSEDLTSELSCLYAELISQRIISRRGRLVLWFDAPEDQRRRLGEVLGLPVSYGPRPDPVPPADPWTLTPPQVNTIQISRERRNQIIRISAAAAAVYLVVAAVIAGFTGWKYFQVHSLKGKLALHADEVATIQKTAERWEAIELAVNPEMYPLERLWRAAKLLPDGIRLTLFEQRGPDILITGEARNAPAAFRYRETFKSDSEWAGYEWQMPQPRLLPNDLAQFRLEGRRPYAQDY